MAYDEIDFIKIATIFFNEYNLEIFEFEDVELASNRLENYTIDNELEHLLELIKTNGQPQISTLHTFDKLL